MCSAAMGVRPASAWAERPVVEGDHASLYAGGYVRGVGSASWLALDLGPEQPSRAASTALVGRLEWRANLGAHVGVDLHQRLQLRGTAGGLGDVGFGGVGPGVGVSASPDRRVDTRSELDDGAGTPLLDHDLDRAAVRIYAGDHEVVLGRQAIGWGQASVFAVTDLWGRLSPFDIDNSQKRGVDAARWLVGWDGTMLDVFVGDGGPDHDVNAGIRVQWYLDRGDLQAGLARRVDEAMAFVATTLDLSQSTLRLEALLPVDTNDGTVSLPAATLGFDRLWSDWSLTVELHHNDQGGTDPDETLARLTALGASGSRSYFVGRYYAAAQTTWQIRPTLRASALVVGNLSDPSALLSGSTMWEPTQDVELTLSAYHGLGTRPILASLDFPTEFGVYGTTMLGGLVVWY